MASLRQRGRRRAWLAVHRWLGLLLGGVIALTCLSGAAVSYWHEIESLLHPAFRPLQAQEDRLSLDVLAPIAVATCPACGPITEVGPGSAADIVTFYFAPAPPGGIDEVVLDASSGRVLERARGADEPVSVLYRFHVTLFAGVTGGWVVGALGGVLTASLLSGLWLWWPRRGQWRWALTVRSPGVGALGFTFDLHKATGVVGGAALLVAAVTGVALAYPTFTASILAATFPPSEAPALSLQPARRASSFPLERLVSIGRARFPFARWTDLDLPTTSEGQVVLTFKQPREATKYGETKVSIDRGSGQILRVRDGLHPTQAAGAQSYIKYLHSGTTLGEPARAVFAIASGLPTLLYISGVWLWWRRRGLRARG